jgi:hypothetical protein
MNEDPKNNGQMTMKEVAFLSTQIGFSVAVTTVIMVIGGKYLDSITGYSPFFTLSGIALALIASLFLVWKLVKPLLARHKTDFSVLSKPKDNK